MHKIKRPGCYQHPGSVQKAAHQRACSMWFLGRPTPSEAHGSSIFYLYTTTGLLKTTRMQALVLMPGMLT
jgi:hypothetical protein